ncbi:MAG: hypothetical protein ABR529_11590 [Actinomycetota bacterium]
MADDIAGITARHISKEIILVVGRLQHRLDDVAELGAAFVDP